MSTLSILLALPFDVYEKTEKQLDDRYVTSLNMTSQEHVLNAMQLQVKYDVIVVYEQLHGTRPFYDFYKLLNETYRDALLIVLRDDLEILAEYIERTRPLPDYSSFLANDREPIAVTEIATTTSVEEHPVEDKPIVSQEWRQQLLDKTAADVKWFEQEDTDQQYWKRASEAVVELNKVLSKVVVFTAASGGVGKTDLSINFSTHASQCGFKTCLLGFNLQNDDIAGRLGLDYKRGKKLMTAFELHLNKQLYIESLEDTMQPFKKLNVLIGIEKPVEGEEMPEEFFEAIIRILKPYYDLIVIDTENNSFSPAYHSVLKMADHIMMITTTHTSVLAQARDEIFDWKEEHDIPLTKIDMLLNKNGEGGFIGVDHVTKHTKREVLAAIPYCKEVLLGAEREEPAVLRHTVQAVRVRKEMERILFRVTGRRNSMEHVVKPTILHFKKKVRSLVDRFTASGKS